MYPQTLLPKEDQALPDAYGLTIHYVNGKKEDFEIASHKLGERVFEFVTHSDDRWNWVQMTSVARIEFDKRFSAIIALKEKRLAVVDSKKRKGAA